MSWFTKARDTVTGAAKNTAGSAVNIVSNTASSTGNAAGNTYGSAASLAGNKAVAGVVPYYSALFAATGNSGAQAALADTWGQAAKPFVGYFAGEEGAAIFNSVVENYATQPEAPQQQQPGFNSGDSGSSFGPVGQTGAGGGLGVVPTILAGVGLLLALVYALTRKRGKKRA